MADVFGAGEGNQGQFPLEQWFYEMPICTRWWTTATVATSILVQCHVVTPFQLFYSFRAVFYKSQVGLDPLSPSVPLCLCHRLTECLLQLQYWRLLTTFFYFGPLSLDLIFHVFFLQRYARLLEESSGRSPARFSWLLLYASTVLLCIAPFFSIAFLGSALSSTLVYIWSRRNRHTRLSFLGLFVFRAPYLPWVLILFSVALHGTVPKDELCGIVVGHSKSGWMECVSGCSADVCLTFALAWFFFSDVYPSIHPGHRPLEPPAWWHRLFDGRETEAATVPIPSPVDTNIAAAAVG